MLAELFLAADPLFADTVENVDDRATRFRPPTPPGWTRVERGGWVQLAKPGMTLPDQGWKIHLSATAADAAKVIDTVCGYCFANELSLKFLRSRQIMEIANSKVAARGSSGKLITVYPPGNLLEPALNDLSELLAGIEGPYILSDLRWDAGPLYVRYGAFKPRTCFSAEGEHVPAVRDPAGRLTPDLRGPTFRVPSWAPVPPFIETRIKTRRGDASEPFPYRVEKALRLSNAGGVYRATELESGRAVVLREARPHAGLDDAGDDAVARLLRARAVLRRLRDLDVVPEVLAHRVHWEHHFLVEEFVEGECLQDAVARRHPLRRPGHTAASRAEYARWALTVLERVEAALAELHERGIVFGDLQPGNVIVRPDGRVCLVDFETAHEVSDDPASGLATAGFAASWARSGFDPDDYALHCLRLALFVPVTQLVRFDPAKIGVLVDAAEELFPLPDGFGRRLRDRLAPPPEFAAGTRAASRHRDCALPAQRPVPDWPVTRDDPEWPAVLDGMRDAIVCAATPEREDRLFPGDPRQFEGQGATLAFGAAGVLHALHATARTGYPGFEEHVDWLVRASGRVDPPRAGLCDGLAGVAYVLAELGRHDEARDALSRMRALDLRGSAAGLFGGLAGIGLGLLRLRDVEQDVDEDAIRIADRLTRVIGGDAGDVAPVTRPGLMHGWSGVALLLTRLYEVTGQARYLDAAASALARDIAHCGVPADGCLQVREGTDWRLSLMRGSAGIAVALRKYLAHRADDDHYRRVLDAVRAGLGTELMLSAGLLEGRSGVLAVLAQLAGPDGDPAIDMHLRRLGWHAVRFHRHLAFPSGDLNRLSMDLGTGTAGVLLAVHGALGLGNSAPGSGGGALRLDGGGPLAWATGTASLTASAAR
ncbi:class III lanthionine synthetase LanKC [Actinomadura sp. 9N215]|uniref:class III lanthionine synthetase LanKC n=1 Tax=Actinomadura sp. 9N215 TaxID=3375150 RepID=UPI0037B77693